MRVNASSEFSDPYLKPTVGNFKYFFNVFLHFSFILLTKDERAKPRNLITK